jgi:hypothetical protein
VNADEVNRGSKVMSLQNSASNAAMYCVLKGLNTSHQHLEVVKHVKLGWPHPAMCTQDEKFQLPKPGGWIYLGKQCESV